MSTVVSGLVSEYCSKWISSSEWISSSVTTVSTAVSGLVAV